MTKEQIKALVASIPASELHNVMGQLNKFQAIKEGKRVPFKMVGDMAVVQ